MPRPPRADEANGLYHALNRGNGQARISRKQADYEAFERITRPSNKETSKGISG